jgi:glucose/arabinose dehydrogenase
MKTRSLLSCIFLLAWIGSLSAQTFPAGFSQVKVASILQATAMDIAPDGRIFVCQRDGTINIIKNGTLLSTPFLKLTTDQNGERGVSGITFDPNFNTNHYVYIYYTATTPQIHNRLSRFTANGDVALAGSELALLDAEPVTAVFHNGGGLAFGKDGKLYLSMGEDNKPSNSQDLTTYKGKLLRLNSDGTAPSDNPYYSSGNSITKKIWCKGLRNPYTLCIQPGTGRIFINNVGSDYFEEIHDGTSAGQNFGWPAVEGYGSDPAYVNPIFAYPHDATGQHGCAITGGAFFNPSSTTWPASYTGKYFYMDYCNGWIWYLTPGTTSYTGNTVFATGLTTKNLALQLGNDGNLYYLNRDEAHAGVYKIIYTSNNPPAISSQPSSVTVPEGQPASFTVSATGAMPLSYQWRKNGTNITGATSSTYTIAHTVAGDAGQYSVKVTNSYGNTTSTNAVLTVTSHNDRPHATILTPAANSTYRAGDVINFSGNATDTEDGTLAASRFEWETEFHHNDHFHPGPYIPPGIKSGSFTIPNTGETSPNVFYRIRLNVTDANGLTDTPFVDIFPLKSNITLNTVPAGLQVTYDGQPKPSPFTTQAVQGMQIGIGVVSPQTSGGHTYTFDHWVQGGSASHTVSIGQTDSSYTAVFNESTSTGCSASGTILREKWDNVTGTTVSDIPLTATPGSSGQITIFETPSNIGDSYGQRIRGYICAPESGNYSFWISSDNNSELWLSTDDTPAHKVKIASISGYTAVREWTKYPSQHSALIHLNAGQRYYIEALHKEGGRSDNLAVGWQLPGGSMERPIPGNRLSPYTASGSSAPTVSITSPPEDYSHSSPANITIKASAASPIGIAKVEFYNGTTKIGEDTDAPYSYVWNNVTTGTYELRAKAIDMDGASTLSEHVHVFITSCTTPIITPAGPTTMCSGSVLLKATTGTGFSYQWKKNGADIPGATTANYTASSSGDYQVKMIEGSCISWSAPVTVKIESGLRASITAGGPTTFCSGGSVKLYANTCSGYTYQWRKNGVDIPGATGSQYTASTSANFQVRVTQSGQNAWSAQVPVTVNVCREEQENEEDDEPLTIVSNDTSFQMKVFPNPNNGLFTIQVNTPIAKEQKIVIRIVNVLGQEVYHKESVSGSDYLKEIVELDSSLKTGVYTLQVMIGEKVESTSIVLSKQ